MRRAARWAACMASAAASSRITPSWVVIRSAPWASASGFRLTAYSRDDAASGCGCGGGENKRSSPPCVSLYATANPASSDDTEVEAAKASAKVAEAAAKAAAAALLSSSPSSSSSSSFSSRVEPDGPTSATTTSTTLAGVKTLNGVATVITAPASSDDGLTQGEPWRARLILAVVACLYGTNYTAIKFMGSFLETSSLLTLRFGLAALALLPALRGVETEVLLAGAEVGMYATLGYGAQAYAMRSLPASQLALVGCLAVLVVPFLDQISGRRKAGVATIGAAVLACGGAALLQSGGIESGAVDEAIGLLPQALALMQPFFFGLSTWRMEAKVQTYPGKALPLTASQVAVVAATSALWSIVSGGFPSDVPEALANSGVDPWALAVLLWLGLVNTALVLFLETDALESVSAAEATVIYSLEPLVGAGLASSTLGEPFPSPLGATLVLGGCLLSSLTGSSTNGDGDEIEGQEKE